MIRRAARMATRQRVSRDARATPRTRSALQRDSGRAGAPDRMRAARPPRKAPQLPSGAAVSPLDATDARHARAAASGVARAAGRPELGLTNLS